MTASRTLHVYIASPAGRAALVPMRSIPEARERLGRSASTNVCVVLSEGVAGGVHPRSSPGEAGRPIQDNKPTVDAQYFSIPLLVCASGDAVNLWHVEGESREGSIFLSATDLRVFDSAWPRRSDPPHRILRELVELALVENWTDAGKLFSLVRQEIDDQNSDFLRTEFQQMSRDISDVTISDRSRLADLRTIKNRLGAIQTYRHNNAFSGEALRRVTDGLNAQVDALATWLNLEKMFEQSVQNRNQDDARLRDKEDLEKAVSLASTAARDANRRLTMIGTTFVIPSLWLAYCSTPYLPQAMFGVYLSSGDGTVLVFGITIILSVVGFLIGWIVSNPSRDS